MGKIFSGLRQNAPAVILLGIMLTLMISAASKKPLSFDEYPNLTYGYRFLTDGPLVEPDGQRMPILALNALFALPFHNDSVAIQANEWTRLLPRIPTMLFALLLGLLVYRWTFELFGRKSAMLALALYALNPNFIAHGKQVTSDVQTGFFIVASIYSFWKLMKAPCRKYFLFCVFLTAGALISKYTCVLLFPVYFLLLGARAFSLRKAKELSAPLIKKSLLLIFLFGAAVLFLINAAYLFQGSFMKTTEYSWKSRAFERFKAVPLPIPLPKVYTLGLDYSSYIQEHPEIGRGSNYILGKLHRKGRWFAFPVMLFLKMPLAFFGILILAAFNRSKSPSYRWEDSLALWVPFAVIFIFFSVCVHAQLGIRYILPVIPFLMIYAGKALTGNTPKWKGLVIAFLLGWSFFSVLLYHPHHMSYFNELIGARKNACRYLADSNLEWEDNTYFLDEYTAKRPLLRIALEPKAPKSGYLLVGANRLTGVYDEDQFRWLRENFKPLTHVAYSHFLFYVPDEKFRELFPEENKNP